jgi:hypothetical protein
MKKTKKKAIMALMACGTEVRAKTCVDGVDLPVRRETYCELRIVRMVAEIW